MGAPPLLHGNGRRSAPFGQLPGPTHLRVLHSNDHAGLRNIDLIGGDNIMFESDYLHSDCNWPHSRNSLQQSLAHVPDGVAP